MQFNGKGRRDQYLFCSTSRAGKYSEHLLFGQKGVTIIKNGKCYSTPVNLFFDSKLIFSVKTSEKFITATFSLFIKQLINIVLGKIGISVTGSEHNSRGCQ